MANEHHDGGQHGHDDALTADDHHPHVLSTPFLAGVLAALLVLTVITVAASYVDLGGRSVNIVVAILIATVKATLVALFFMHLRWDKPFNAIVLLTSLGMVGLFLGISTTDMLEVVGEKDPHFAEEGYKRRREALGYGAEETTNPGAEAAAALQGTAAGMFGALAATFEDSAHPVTEAKVELGRMLYFETRLSKNHDISCNTCHDLARYGVDGEKTSPGHKGQRGARNSPTVYNAAGHAMQFWDGRAADVEEQALGPILNPVEMAMPSEEQVLKVLRSIPGYEEKFQAAFPGEADPITFPNVGKAIGAFERTLSTPAPFDRFVAGDLTALTEQQQRGFQTYMEVGCTACHAGPLFGGMIMQKLGLVKPYPSEDQGKFEVTGRASDKLMFKTPSLRNVEMTAPYMHDGSIATLEEVTHMMAEYQLGRQLTDEQVADIVAFMKSLTGELPPADKIAAPTLPPSGPDTPQPDPS